MRVAIVHPSLNVMGGAEQVAMAALEAFESQAYETCLVTLEKTNWNHVERLRGSRPKVHHEVTYPRLRLPLPYEPMHSKWIYRFLLRSLGTTDNGFDLVVNTQPERLYTDADTFYIHDPHMLMLGIRPKRNLFNPVWSIYRKSRRYILEKLRKLLQVNMVLANSNYCKQFLEKHWNIGATVVHPPVDVNLYRDSCLHRDHSKPWVVTVSRFCSSKNLEVIPDMAVRVPEARFIIIGSISTSNGNPIERAVFKILGEEDSVVAELRSRAMKLGVADRIVLMPNATFTQKLKVMSKAQIYLHTGPNEGFGMAVAEAMAAGLAPVIHKSGGPWIDIFDKSQGLCGYAFESVEEAVQHVSCLLHTRAQRMTITEAAKERVRSFSKDEFAADFLSAATGC